VCISFFPNRYDLYVWFGFLKAVNWTGSGLTEHSYNVLLCKTFQLTEHSYNWLLYRNQCLFLKEYFCSCNLSTCSDDFQSNSTPLALTKTKSYKFIPNFGVSSPSPARLNDLCDFKIGLVRTLYDPYRRAIATSKIETKFQQMSQLTFVNPRW